MPGFPRDRIAGVVIEDSGGLGPYGRKDPDCFVFLYGNQIRRLLDHAQGPDTVIRTWVHESIHARQAYSQRYFAEYGAFSGYEEGLAEGLARYIVRKRAGLDPLQASYEYYVEAYVSLADAFQFDTIALWSQLWTVAMGEVRSAFAPVVDQLRRENTGHSFSGVQRLLLQRTADRLFGSERRRLSPNRATMLQTWETILR